MSYGHNAGTYHTYEELIRAETLLDAEFHKEESRLIGLINQYRQDFEQKHASLSRKHAKQLDDMLVGEEFLREHAIERDAAEHIYGREVVDKLYAQRVSELKEKFVNQHNQFMNILKQKQDLYERLRLQLREQFRELMQESVSRLRIESEYEEMMRGHEERQAWNNSSHLPEDEQHAYVARAIDESREAYVARVQAIERADRRWLVNQGSSSSSSSSRGL